MLFVSYLHVTDTAGPMTIVNGLSATAKH